MLHNKRPLKIRLANIDAPEKKQAFGQASKQSLAEMCFGQDATYKTQTIDKYGRTVALVTCDGIDANRAQVERGLAWVYVRYNKDGSLLYFQSIAKNQRGGVWAEANPTPPWKFRHPLVTKVADASGCITGPKGGRYQLVGGRKRYGRQ